MTPPWAADALRRAVAEAVRRVSAGDPLKLVWWYSLLQLLDDHTSAVQQLGVGSGASVWADEPVRTGEPRVDAASAAPAEHLARRDGWTVPAWALDPSRETPERWFVTRVSPLVPRARGAHHAGRAGSGVNDADDIAFLYRQIGSTTVEEGLDLVESTYRGRPVAARTQLLPEEIVAAMNEIGGAGGGS